MGGAFRERFVERKKKMYEPTPKTFPAGPMHRKFSLPYAHLKAAPAVTRTVRVTHKCYVRKESEKNEKRQNKNIALRMRTESSARSFFRSESVHDSISFLCERVTTLNGPLFLLETKKRATYRYHSGYAHPETAKITKIVFRVHFFAEFVLGTG